MENNRWTLAFQGDNAALEQPFLEYYFRRFYRHIQMCHIYSMVAWLGWFAIGATADQTLIDLYITQTFGIVWPAFLVGLLLSRSEKYIHWYPVAQFVYVVLTGLCSLYIVRVGPTDFYSINVMAFSFSFIFAYMIIRARFIVALGASCSISVLFISLALNWSHVPLVLKISSIAYIVLLNILGAIAAYAAEKTVRQSFYTSHTLNEQRELLDNTNRKLLEANTKLGEMTMVDGLTTVFNRRYFDQILNQEWARLRRTKHPLSIIMVDVDFFKKYNDTYGHQAGDCCLKTIATLIKSVLQRPSDKVFRYGGEEFVVLLPETERSGAMHVAELIQQQMTEQQLPHANSDVCPHVTLSMGIATLEYEYLLGPDELVREADRALYEAKENGRNRFILAEA